MKKMIHAAGIALAMFAGATTLQANEIKPYIGVGVGSFSFDIKVPLLAMNGSGSSVGYFGIVGADLHELFAIEVRGGSTNKAGVFATEYKYDYFFSYLAKLKYAPSDQVSLYALAGGTSAKITTTAGLNSTKNGLTFGGGVDIKINDNISAGAEWVRYWSGVTINSVAEATVDGISGTLTYHF